MRLITKAVYKFDELSESAKQKAIEQYADIQVDYHWWEHIYDDAERIGLKIKSFDIYRKDIDIVYEYNPDDVAFRIFKEWGEGTDMYRLAKEYITKYNSMYATVEDDDCIYDTDEITELDNEFLKDLGEHFLSFLTSEYEWRTSDESIAECIEANDFEFYENGTRY